MQNTDLFTLMLERMGKTAIQTFFNGTLDLSEDKYLQAHRTLICLTHRRYYLIEDDAFGLHKHLLKPYGRHTCSLTVEKRMYNYRVCLARRYVECTFGILSNKWRLFHRAINLDPGYAMDIVKACVFVHLGL